MTPRQERLRKAYEFKIGKERTKKLSDDQILLLSKYYNSLSENEQSKIDNYLAQGRSNDLTDMADAFISENTQDAYEPSDVIKQYDKKFDEAVAAYNKKVEDFKKKEDRRIAGMFQYDKPIGPEAMQGPKEPPKKRKPQVDDDTWEGEVQDQLGTKIDEILEQIRNEPLPQPAKTKRRKTRGKKKFDRKVLSSETMGLGEQLTEIKANVIDTRLALFNMYKIDKERFEFKKKIDKKLTTQLAAKRREAELEANLQPGEENTSEKLSEEKEDSALGGLLDFLLGPFKKAGIAGLTATLGALALPLVLDGVEAFLTRETKGERNQPWDPLGIIPDPKGDEEDDPLTKFFNFLIPAPENSADPNVASGKRTRESEAQGFSDFWSDIFRSPEESNEPSVRSGDRTPETGFDYVPSMDEMPVRRAYDGGKFTQGVKKPLRPITSIPPVDPRVKKLTEPLSSAITIPQKVATLGVLSFAQSMVKPFSTVLPDEAIAKIDTLFKDVLSKSGLGGFNLDTSGENLFDKISNFAGDLVNELLGIKKANAQPKSTPPPAPPEGAPLTSPSGDQYFGPAYGEPQTPVVPSAPVASNATADQALLAAISALEGGNAQARADVAQSIYNRANDPEKRYGSSISEVITADGQYQPAYIDPNVSKGPGTRTDPAWKRVKDRNSAIDAMMSYYAKRGQPRSRASVAKLFDETMGALANRGMQEKAAEHVGGRTEFLGAKSKIDPLDQAEMRTRGTAADNQFFTAYGTGGDRNESIARGPAAVPEGLFPMPKAATPAPPPPVQNPRREMNMFERFINYLGGTPTQQAAPQEIKPPQNTSPVGSEPMLQPGGY